MLKAKPVQKSGGARRRVKHKPKKPEQLSPLDLYKDHKAKGNIFDKKLLQYRYIIHTDLETDDMITLMMFTAFIKANEQYFESRNHFPIYGFIVGETKDKRAKVQRAREFLEHFAVVLEWNDPEHHLYKSYIAAANRVWFSGESDKTFDHERDLCKDQEAFDDEDYPEGDEFKNCIDTLLGVKPNNLFALYLKPVRFFQSFADKPDVIEHLCKIPGAMYGSWNVRCVLEESPELKDLILRFLNRGEKDAPLVYTESFLALGQNNYVTQSDAPKFFRRLDEGKDDFASCIKDVMYSWNDNILERHSKTLIKQFPEFKSVDFDDYSSFQKTVDTITTDNPKIKNIIKVLGSIVKTGGAQFVYADPLAFIATLMAGGLLKKTPFRLQRSLIKFDEKSYIQTYGAESKTSVLLPRENINSKHCKSAKKYLDNMISGAVELVDF